MNHINRYIIQGDRLLNLSVVASANEEGVTFEKVTVAPTKERAQVPFGLDYAFIVEESGTLLWGDQEIEVEAGTVLFIIYAWGNKGINVVDNRDLITVKNEEIFNYCKARIEEEKQHELTLNNSDQSESKIMRG